MTPEEEIRRVLHPEAHERLNDVYKPMEFNPRPQAAEPCIDPDEIGGRPWYQEQPEPWWPYILGAVCAILALVLVFAPVGVLN
jgi:hypothetical protein